VGARATVELVNAIRRCAAEKLSMTETARQLTSRRHRLTRDSVSGIARRRGIVFLAVSGFQPRRVAPDTPLVLLAAVPASLLPYVEVNLPRFRRVVMYRFYGRNMWRVRLKRGWCHISSVLVPGRVLKAAAAKCERTEIAPWS
jgi:hypothetical protein